MILFIALPDAQDKDGAGVIAFPLPLLPRRCPLCGEDAIAGHGQRRKQAHDQCHDWIWVRRGLCRRCRKTFTILPGWSSPYGHYSSRCRQQDWETRCDSGGSWEQSVPHTKDPARLPDPSTLRRWASRRVLSLCCALRVLCFRWIAGRTFLQAPTILAWGWPAAGRNLHLETNSP